MATCLKGLLETKEPFTTPFEDWGLSCSNLPTADSLWGANSVDRNRVIEQPLEF